jgi:hypothetical protein
MPSLPPMMWVILVLGVLFIAVRMWANRAEERRRAAHEERMARLLAEREAGPSSLAAVTSDAPPKPAPEAPAAEAREAIKVRCRACKALNDESATKCAECGAEL